MSFEIMAEAGVRPASILLTWLSPSGDIGRLFLCRKDKGAAEWDADWTKELDMKTTRYEDFGVEVGKEYEYRLWAEGKPYIFSNVLAGIDVPAKDNRGKVILLVDRELEKLADIDLSLDARMKAALFGLQEVMELDGWQVIRYDAGRDQSPEELLEVIKGHYTADPENVKAVYLFGHITIPKSGPVSPDGHGGARYANADSFYGIMDGGAGELWGVSDTSDPQYPFGVYLKSALPARQALQVGRVDFHNIFGEMDEDDAYLTAAPKSLTDGRRLMSEAEFLINYTEKANDYKMNRRTLPITGQAFSLDGLFSDSLDEYYRSFEAFGGMDGFGFQFLNSSPGYSLGLLEENESYSFGTFRAGGANHTGFANGSVRSYMFYDKIYKMHFWSFLSSYHWEWEKYNAILKAPLTMKDYGLVSSWSGRLSYYTTPSLDLHHLGLGESFGHSYMESVNQNRQLYINLLGDPTLRLFPMDPVSDVKGYKYPEEDIICLTWEKSKDALSGYNVYAKNGSGSYDRINKTQIKDNRYFIREPKNETGEYMVKAVALTKTFSGTFYNMSVGVYADETKDGPGIPVPPREMLSDVVFGEGFITVDVDLAGHGSAVLVAAIYGGQGLLAAKTAPVAESGTVTVENIALTEAYDSVKLMLWNNANEMTPLCEYKAVD